MRIVADTNIVISGLIWRGPPRRVLDAARAGIITLFTSPALIDELQDVVSRPRFARFLQPLAATPERLTHSYLSFALLTNPPAIAPVVTADPDDDAVVACALAAGADAIISGDHHLLDLREYRNIPILTAAALLALLDPPTTSP